MSQFKKCGLNKSKNGRNLAEENHKSEKVRLKNSLSETSQPFKNVT